MTLPRKKLSPDIEREIIKRFRGRGAALSSRATTDSSFQRRKQYKPEDSLRPPYYRDADRILHSKAYSRYIDKTQVFYRVDNDHVTHRVLHVQLVSKIARTIGRALGLNEDLIEAIALGHDIGHVPYGHAGESILSDLCENVYRIGKFRHNVQAIRFLDKIEDKDLTLQVLDGILCHDGEVNDQTLKPNNDDLNWESFDLKLKQGTGIIPSTNEGCVVRFADSIAYLGRDLQDARELGLLKSEDELRNYPQICKELFDIRIHSCDKINWIILDTLIKDIIQTSYYKEEISFSDDISKCVKELKEFNNEYIYHNPKVTEQKPKIRHMFETLFERCLMDFFDRNESTPIYEDMWKCTWISQGYKDSITPPELVRDYIAGMTDRYFDQKFSEFVIPARRRDFR